MVTGENVQDAISGVDQNGRPQVSITLDSAGGKLMQGNTAKNVGKQMAVLFIENKQKITHGEIDPATGKPTEIRTPYSESKIINQATIQGVFGSSFQITGLNSPAEASELALLLRAGALAAPMYFVEERTIGLAWTRKYQKRHILNRSRLSVGIFIYDYLLSLLWSIQPR